MREILFRAKGQTSDKWHEGLLTRLDQDVCHIKDNRHNEWICDPQTVCQYTGLTDKNGRKIFEGDILSFSAYSENCKGDVRFIKGNFTIWCGKCAPFLDDALEKHSAIVIGNIFDNPELIGEQP
nr:YopX family protein [uncultured Acetatifactor sp.]